MSKLTDALRERGIANPHMFARAAKEQGGTGVYVDFTAADNGRGGHRAYFQVIDIARKTDPDGYWRHYGHKTFTTFGRDKADVRAAAIAWVSEYTKTNPMDWVPGPYRGTFVLKSDRKLVV